MKKLVFSLAIMATALVNAQTVSDSIQLDPQKQQNAAQRILSGNYGKAVTVGGYGEMLYNQPEGDNGTLDVQRLVMLFGYKFDDKILKLKKFRAKASKASMAQSLIKKLDKIDRICKTPMRQLSDQSLG